MNREQYIIDKYKINISKKPPYYIKISRWKHLPYLLNELEIKTGAEVGVEQCKYSECLLSKIPDLKLHCIDCWETYKDYREKKQGKYEEYYKKAVEKTKPFGDRAVLVKKYSMDAVKDFEDESLDFVYIDANHEFQQVTNDIAEWSKMVKKGGIIAGHDFTRLVNEYERIDVKDVVQAWTYSKGIKVWFVTDEGDRMPSWFWIKK